MSSASLIAPLGGASDAIVIHNYKILNKIGQGGFSSVYKAQHKKNNRIVALKIEKTKDSKSILHESKILSYLNRELSSIVVPTLFWYGAFGKMVGIATTFYSTSMTEILSQNLSITMKIDLSKQLINIIRQIHSVFVIHCDIKPDNFMCYNDGNNGLIKLVIIDFGMSRLFVDSQQTTKHLPNKISDSLFGTPKYASYNIHLGHKYSRRDDLISIGYLLMTVFDIVLPWSALPVLQNDDQSQRLLSHCDQSQRLLSHCDHPHNLYRRDLKMYDILVEYLRKMDFADILIPYFTDVYALKYDEPPAYSSLVNYFITP
jgi:serine/threonine protein kinase